LGGLVSRAEGESARPAEMADVVGVVVSAFLFTPFFCWRQTGMTTGNREREREVGTGKDKTGVDL